MPRRGRTFLCRQSLKGSPPSDFPLSKETGAARTRPSLAPSPFFAFLRPLLLTAPTIGGLVEEQQTSDSFYQIC